MEQALTTEELCRRLKPIFGSRIDQLYLKYTLADNRKDKEEIAQFISVLYEKNLNTTLLGDKILLVPPTEAVIKGDYSLGLVSYADKDLYPFGVRDKDLVRHACITGMSGSGKTNLAFLLISQLIKANKPFIIFDWKKSFRPLLNLDKKMVLFTVGKEEIANQFRVNINRPPPGVDPKEWIGIISDLLSECFFTSYGVHKMLKETLDAAFKDFGVYNGSDHYPTWHHIKQRLEERAGDLQKGRSRESEWMESAMRIAHSLTFGNFGEVVNAKSSTYLNVDDLFDMRTVFELASLDTSEKKFFCEYILTYIYKLKKGAENQKREFNFVILVDEAHNIFLKERPNFMNETVTDMIYREIREYGISLICLDQHISKLSEVVVGNSATSIAFQQMLPQDLETVSNLMMMRDQKKYFSMLPVGFGIVKLAERYFNPFLIKVPLAEFKQGIVSDEAVATRAKELTREIVRRKAFQNSLKDDNLKKVVKALNRAEYLKVDNESLTADEFTQYTKYLSFHEPAFNFLKYALEKRRTITEIYDVMGLSTRKCDEAKNDLLYRRLIAVEEEHSEKGLKKFVIVTNKGKEMFEYVQNLKSDSFTTPEAEKKEDDLALTGKLFKREAQKTEISQVSNTKSHSPSHSLDQKITQKLKRKRE
jgi:hypothetical protein